MEIHAGTGKGCLRASGFIGALAVGLGAFGAHGLEEHLIETGHLATWQTAAHYHLLHAAVLLLLAFQGAAFRLAWKLMAAGVVIFSGSLYLLCLSGMGWLGAVTPIGGGLLIGGWLALLGAGRGKVGTEPDPPR